MQHLCTARNHAAGVKSSLDSRMHVYTLIYAGTMVQETGTLKEESLNVNLLIELELVSHCSVAGTNFWEKNESA